MSAILFRRTIVAQRGRLLVVWLGLALWGFLLPVVYATFGKDVEQIIQSGLFADAMKVLGRFTGGDVFSLRGSLALGLVHPIALALVAVFAVGFPVASVAGERQRGTLEVLLARPVARRALYLTLLAATVLFVALSVAATLCGMVAGAVLYGVAADLQAADLLAAWANDVLLYGAIGALALAASVTFDRLGPALGLSLGFVIASYAVDILAKLWPDAAWIGTYSIFHYFAPTEVLAGRANPADVAVLVAVLVVAVGYALWVFPRRDLAAPS